MKKRAIPVFLAVLALALMGTGQGRPSVPAAAETILPPPADSLVGHPKMEFELSQLVSAPHRVGKLASESGRPVKLSVVRDGTVRVVIEGLDLGSGLPSDAVRLALSQQVAALGGRVETTYHRLVQAVIPVSSLQTLADSPAVRYVRRPYRAKLLDVTSEGVASTGANAWIQQASFYGLGSEVKVCVLDLGFEGYESLKGSELPSDVVVRSFRSDGDIEAGIVHGAACAEIVHDMVPQAKLYLVNFDTDVEEHNAVEWIVQQGVNVISYSIGWINAGDGAGNGPIDADVEYASQHGLIWSSSAGNEAINHYLAPFNDSNGNGWDNFTSTDEILDFEVPAYEIVGAFLNWNDWGTWNGYDFSGADQDFDLYLYIWTGASWVLVDSSKNVQNGSQWPTEEIYGWYADFTTRWGVAIRKVHTTHSNNVELFIQGNDDAVEYNVTASSLVQPADSAQAVTAGAVDAIGGFYHYYSSQGPTKDGRIKPDFGAPSGVSTATYGTMGFYGTSASAPHLAGAFGLLLGQTPYTPDQVYKVLISRAIDMGAPGKDDLFGWGRLYLKK
jgi:hypothetical protein